MQRDSLFNFQCQQCSRCCHHQAIQLNPYEILCLARHLGQGTGQFIARHTSNHGLFLRFRDGGACAFLSEQGCSVHPARPLVCRLYPLGREIDLQEGESFRLLKRHENCPATVHQQGSLQAYLDGQGADPFLRAADLYLEVVLEMHEVLRRSAPSAPGQPALTGPMASEKEGVNPWLDVDAVLGRAAVIDDPWRAMQAHLAAIRQWLTDMEKEASDA